MNVRKNARASRIAASVGAESSPSENRPRGEDVDERRPGPAMATRPDTDSHGPPEERTQEVPVAEADEAVGALPVDREGLAEALQLLASRGRGIQPVGDQLVGGDRRRIEEPAGVQSAGPGRSRARRRVLRRPPSAPPRARRRSSSRPSSGAALPPRPPGDSGAHGRRSRASRSRCPIGAGRSSPRTRPAPRSLVRDLQGLGERGRRRSACTGRLARERRGERRREDGAARVREARGDRAAQVDRPRAARIRRCRTLSTAITSAIEHEHARGRSVVHRSRFLLDRPAAGRRHPALRGAADATLLASRDADRRVHDLPRDPRSASAGEPPGEGDRRRAPRRPRPRPARVVGPIVTGAVDDEAYGGGPGMVMKPEPFFAAVESLDPDRGRVLLLSPAGRRLDQAFVRELAGEEHLTLLCGRYEGVDERVVGGLARRGGVDRRLRARRGGGPGSRGDRGRHPARSPA